MVVKNATAFHGIAPGRAETDSETTLFEWVGKKGDGEKRKN